MVGGMAADQDSEHLRRSRFNDSLFDDEAAEDVMAYMIQRMENVVRHNEVFKQMFPDTCEINQFEFLTNLKFKFFNFRLCHIC